MHLLDLCNEMLQYILSFISAGRDMGSVLDVCSSLRSNGLEFLRNSRKQSSVVRINRVLKKHQWIEIVRHYGGSIMAIVTLSFRRNIALRNQWRTNIITTKTITTIVTIENGVVSLNYPYHKSSLLRFMYQSLIAYYNLALSVLMVKQHTDYHGEIIPDYRVYCSENKLVLSGVVKNKFRSLVYDSPTTDTWTETRQCIHSLIKLMFRYYAEIYVTIKYTDETVRYHTHARCSTTMTTTFFHLSECYNICYIYLSYDKHVVCCNVV